MIQLELQDMQGLIARGYQELKAACLVLLHITDRSDAKSYLQWLVSSNLITPALKEKADASQKKGVGIIRAIHIAFTYKGLEALGLSRDILDTFPREFIEGMTEFSRSIILGDHGKNHPSNWEWGGNNGKAVHVVLLVYAQNDQELAMLLQQQRDAFRGIQVIKEEGTCELAQSKEHFGFSDGISQPPMEGLKTEGAKKYRVKSSIRAGEFVLGYRNEYGQYSEGPFVKSAGDPGNILPVKDQENALKDLGKNGTFLVYRQMKQEVYRFWKFLKDHSNEPAEIGSKDPSTEAAIKLGAKMIGRWPGGASLVNNPRYIERYEPADREFSYWKMDRDGLKCPFGAHIRRTNPRDQLFSERDFEASKRMIRKHQLLRRGRTFGKPLVESMDPTDILALDKDDDVARGLHFICLAGDINRQFEFVQNVWINNAVFAELNNEVDPVVGTREMWADTEHNDDFTCPANPVRRKYKGIPQFTYVIGGAYFFMPGIKALKFIANYNEEIVVINS